MPHCLVFSWHSVNIYSGRNEKIRALVAKESQESTGVEAVSIQESTAVLPTSLPHWLRHLQPTAVLAPLLSTVLSHHFWLHCRQATEFACVMSQVGAGVSRPEYRALITWFLTFLVSCGYLFLTCFKHLFQKCWQFPEMPLEKKISIHPLTSVWLVISPCADLQVCCLCQARPSLNLFTLI